MKVEVDNCNRWLVLSVDNKKYKVIVSTDTDRVWIHKDDKEWIENPTDAKMLESLVLELLTYQTRREIAIKNLLK